MAIFSTYEKIVLALCFLAVAVLIGLLVYDHTIYETHTKIITPITITQETENTNGKVMDDCFNSYPIYGDTYGDTESTLRLMYCKEHKTPCEITIADHLFGEYGISSVSIVNVSASPSCKRT